MPDLWLSAFPVTSGHSFSTKHEQLQNTQGWLQTSTCPRDTCYSWVRSYHSLRLPSRHPTHPCTTRETQQADLQDRPPSSRKYFQRSDEQEWNVALQICVPYKGHQLMCNSPGLTVASLDPSICHPNEKHLWTLLPFLQDSLAVERGWPGARPAETAQWGGGGDGEGCWGTNSHHLLKSRYRWMKQLFWVLWSVWAPPRQERVWQTGKSAVEATHFIRGIEHMANEERRWVQGRFNLEKKRLRWVLELPAGNGARAEASGKRARGNGPKLQQQKCWFYIRRMNFHLEVKHINHIPRTAAEPFSLGSFQSRWGPEQTGAILKLTLLWGESWVRNVQESFQSKLF